MPIIIAERLKLSSRSGIFKYNSARKEVDQIVLREMARTKERDSDMSI
jgi:hypothetical protein